MGQEDLTKLMNEKDNLLFRVWVDGVVADISVKKRFTYGHLDFSVNSLIMDIMMNKDRFCYFNRPHTSVLNDIRRRMLYIGWGSLNTKFPFRLKKMLEKGYTLSEGSELLNTLEQRYAPYGNKNRYFRIYESDTKEPSTTFSGKIELTQHKSKVITEKDFYEQLEKLKRLLEEKEGMLEEKEGILEEKEGMLE